MGVIQLWQKFASYAGRNGLGAALCAAVEELLHGGRGPDGHKYLYTPLDRGLWEAQRRNTAREHIGFSLLVPLYNTPPAYLRALIDSVTGQSHGNWELLLGDASPAGASGDDADAGESGDLAALAASYGDARIRYVRLEGNGGISANTNALLPLAAKEFVGLLDHDDWLEPHALYAMAAAIEGYRQQYCGENPAMLYSDEDKCDGEGSAFFAPHFKPDFDLELLLSNNYICHFLVMERGLMASLGFRPAFDGAQDYDLLLRAVAALGREGGGFTGNGRWRRRILHIPQILYHWRCHASSTAANPASKAYAYEAGARALGDFLDAVGWRGKVRPLAHLGFYRVEYIPDIWSARPEVAAVGGPVYGWGRICGGGWDARWRILHKGLPRGFSGYMHRAALGQEALALDLRNLRLRPEDGAVAALWEQTLGRPPVWREDGGMELPPGLDPEEAAKALGLALAKAGYVLLWRPRHIWR